MKTLTLTDDTWDRLTRLKLDIKSKTLDEGIVYLFNKVDGDNHR